VKEFVAVFIGYPEIRREQEDSLPHQTAHSITVLAVSRAAITGRPFGCASKK
jgi:hypothetical protein